MPENRQLDLPFLAKLAKKPEGVLAMDYVQGVNRAIDLIMRDLAQPLRLPALADAAGLSPFHFQRIFKALLGETPAQFVKRQRLERALYLMTHAPTRPLTAVALDCGFSSSSDFSRSFRQHHGMAPSAFDLTRFRETRREELARVLSAQGVAPHLAFLPAGQNPDGFVASLRDLPARTVAYVRVRDPYREGQVQAAYERLLAWADARGLADGQWMGYMWDEPETVALDQCRYDAALVIDEGIDFEPAGEIGRYRFPPMRVAELVMRGDLAMEARAIDWLYQTWLPRSGHVPDDQPKFEAWVGRPYAHGTEHFELACHLPVRPG